MPNTVVKLTNAESTWLEAAREDRKLLIKKKHIRQDVLFACFHKEAKRCCLREGACVPIAAVQLKIEGFARDDETGKE